MSRKGKKKNKSKAAPVHSGQTSPADSAPNSDSSGKTPKKQISKRRRWLFRCVALSIPILLLGLIEVGLRIAGVGAPLMLVNKIDNGSKVLNRQLNSAVDHSWFGQYELGGPVQHRFDVPKPKEVFRVIVVGGSTVLGFPYDPALAFPARMQAILQGQLPDRKVEVLNCGVIAVNSFSVIDMVQQASNVEPDLIVVHTGHNEFYGPGGVGSTALSVPSFLFSTATHFRRCRLFQLLQQVMPSGKASQESPQAALPASVEIGRNSQLFKQAEDRYRANLTGMAQHAKSAGIPILFTTVSANIRDHSPVSFLVPAELDDIRLKQWSILFDQARQFSAADKHEEAITYFKQAEAVSSESSLLQYRMGQTLDALKRYDESYDAFSLARDIDGCRFRAPSSFRKIVTQVTEASGGDVFLLDTADHIHKSCEPAAPGYQLYLEHVHYNSQGHAVLAKSIGMWIVENLLEKDWDGLAPGQSPKMIQADDVTALTFALEVMSTFPMTKTFDANLHTNHLLQKISVAFEELSDDVRPSYEDSSPGELGTDLTANLAERLKENEAIDAEVRIRKLDFARKPWSDESAYGLAECLTRAKQYTDAAKCLSEAIRLNPSNTRYIELKKQIGQNAK